MKARYLYFALAFFMLTTHVYALPITYEIGANEFDGLGTPTGNSYAITITYESTTADTNPDPERGEFSGGLGSISVLRNGAPVAFGPVTSDVLRTRSGAVGFDLFDVRFQSGADEVRWSSEWSMGTMFPSNTLPTSLNTAQLLLGTLSISGSLIGEAQDSFSDIFLFTASTDSVPVTESSPLVLLGVGLMFLFGLGGVKMQAQSH